MENKNVIVTGGLGFIGSHIVEELVDNNKVTIIDNLSTGKMENLANPKHPNLTIIKGDLNDLDLIPILKGNDYIFHLAAAASVPGSVENPMYTHINNVDTTAKLLIAAKDAGIKKIVFSSSSAVYGENPNMPLKETEPYMPTSPYAASKATGELYLKSFTESYGLNSTSLRYFNVFGPKQDVNSQYAAVIPNFIHAIIHNQQPVIYGDGEQTRDFIFIKDIVKANIAAAESDYNGIVNVAAGEALTINELFDIIAEVLDTDIKPEYLPERAGDIKHSFANVDNMKNINFSVDKSKFKEQLQETVKWFKTQM
jgi:UDP-glucose 4-epimerase